MRITNCKSKEKGRKEEANEQEEKENEEEEGEGGGEEIKVDENKGVELGNNPKKMC